MTALTAPLPLRLTSVWAGFREAVPIPHRYGETGGTPLQYDQGRRQWVWADHPVLAIDTVLVDGQPVQNWQWANQQDSTGRAVAMIAFDAPIAEGAHVLARGRGKLHARTGQLITSPADAVHDVLASIAGRATADLAGFRAECARAGLTIAGTLDGTESVQSAVRGLCASVGAVFSPDIRGLCRLWPGGELPAPVETVDGRCAVASSCDLDAVVTDLTVHYAHEDGQPLRTLRLDAPAAIARYGRRSATLDAPWLRAPRVAHAVASRLLQQQARPQWRVTATGLPRAVRVGDAVTLDHALLPVSGPHLVLARTADLAAGVHAVDLTVPVGTAPAVRLVSQASRLEPEQYASAAVQTIGSERVLTLLDDDGTPLAGATVLLDGQWTRYTDGAGRVAFPVSIMEPGEHTLLITAPDGRTLETTVLVP